MKKTLFFRAALAMALLAGAAAPVRALQYPTAWFGKIVSNGDFLQGHSTRDTDGVGAYASVQLYGGPNDVGGNLLVYQFSNDASTAYFGCMKSRATVKGVQAAVQPGDDLCEINASGSDGTHYVDPFTLDISVDGPVTPGHIPANFSIWLSDGVSRWSKQGLFIDHNANVYVRNGYLGVGSIFGWAPPAYSGFVVPYPLTVTEPLAGTMAAFYYTNSGGGGAQIVTSNGYSASQPVYAFWFNSGTGLGNPALNTISFLVNGYEAARILPNGNFGFGGQTNPQYPVDVTGAIHATTYIAGGGGAYATVNAWSSVPTGARAYVTDAASCASRLSAVTGGGSTFCPVVYNGSAWLQD
jgi:hypothetical protein